MAFGDPVTIVFPTAGSTACPRTSSGVNSGEFTSATGSTKVLVSHQYGKRTRRAIRVTFKKISADPLVTGNNLEYSTSVTLTVDEPKSGMTRAEIKDIGDGLIAFLTASSGANAVKFYGGEN